jgi:predicted RNase H-like HicB family nuclease
MAILGQAYIEGSFFDIVGSRLSPLGVSMKTYTFKVVVEPDNGRWHAYCPTLQKYGAVTWGATREEAYRHIQEVVQMVIEELAEDGIAIPEGPREEVEVFPDTRVAVTL